MELTHPAQLSTLGSPSLLWRWALTDRYQLEECIGTGAVGEVWRATDQELGRTVALKVLVAGSTEKAARRFEQEGRVHASLGHPGVVPVYGLGSLPDGRRYIAMQLVDGSTLADLLTAGPLEVPRALDLFLKACDAVAYAHDRSVRHRDLKPDNVLVGQHGEVYVTDWGLAREERDTRTRLTRMGQVMGTPYYMSPEAALGRGREAGPEADVYSLGALLYTLLSGRPPFDTTDTYEVIQRVAAGQVVPLRSVAPTLPDALVRVVERAMSLDPTLRPPTARELAAEVREAQKPPPPRRSLAVPLLSLALLLALGALGLSAGLNLVQLWW